MTIPAPLAELLERNKEHQEYVKSMPSPPLDMPTMHKWAQENGGGVMVITCSDPRLNPYRILGVDAAREMKTVMIRNAGGRTFDALRSLAVLGTIGNPGTIVVMHHTDCGMTHFHDATVKKHLYEISPEGGDEIEGIKRYGEILGSIDDSIKEDVAQLRKSPFIAKGTAIVGLKYDVFTGKLEEMESWTR